MLNDTTKRNIQAARDVLVGKVPDPKAQVEQITTALIYKFMHDLDQQAVSLGGKARFFTGEYEQFAWPNLLDTRLSGDRRLDLYMRAITSMERNPNLPQLFRDIFKGAFLPYNDPQTLSLFLKEIDKFNYTHSEELGNAYEMLLSIMSSQGDAGQFRTPRHIIDFMVAVVDPKKHETILDPACGTAGFLISAFKHIRKHNSSNFHAQKNHVLADGESAVETYLHDDPAWDGNQLTPEEKKHLMSNIQGYDISPDMVRLSRVNLYLHGFQSPRISEYDTLTSEDRWDESFDVILANPPFMSPKGGIQPHKRFQVQARRSEVLFVDYILEHLNINGRAGIIVPEGVIFRNETAYKQLRKLLVEDGLYCVVSLPAGVFNPYSGVKTSILFFDKALAKQRDEVLFVKIDTDGFDLGAQRRKMNRNDLPDALRVIQAWQKSEKVESDLALWVGKEKICKDSTFSLNGDQYKENEIFSNKKWPLVNLGEIADYINGYPFKPIDWKKQGRKIIRIQNLTGTSDEFNYYEKDDIPEKYLVKKGDLLISWSATIGFYIWEDDEALLNQHIFRVEPKENILKEYLYSLRSRIVRDILNSVHGNTMRHITKGRFDNIKIPLPPLEVQRDIVEQIEVKQAAIDAARAVIAALEKERRFFARELQGRDDVEWVRLGDVANVIAGQSPKGEYYNNEGEGTPFHQGKTEFGDIYLGTAKKWTNQVTRLAEEGDIVMSVRAPVGPVNLVQSQICIGRGLAAIKPLKINGKFLFFLLKSIEDSIQGGGGSVFDSISKDQICKLKIPLPNRKIQDYLASKREIEEKIIFENLSLIEIMEKKIETLVENI